MGVGMSEEGANKSEHGRLKYCHRREHTQRLRRRSRVRRVVHSCSENSTVVDVTLQVGVEQPNALYTKGV